MPLSNRIKLILLCAWVNMYVIESIHKTSISHLKAAWLSTCPIWKLQQGTKVLRHFCKMAPFCIVDIPIPFPCVPPPPSRKSDVVF